ncbi:rab11 family-interacting protein 3 isoform X1 [Scleropages formosus]|uniref:RAB11 family interacting protein 3 (class II) n=1 Tax=Scleropages formosus TaxID=113540 RepID=A0A8C9V678_SCLFO|nr:rab11 family-interacting protein 3 isoform X1 [Scleropages formosus]
MEQVLLSSPGGRSEWDLEQKPSLGFLLLDPGEGAALSKGSEGGSDSGLDFGEADKELVSFNLDKILQGNALDLNQLFQSSGYSGVDQILSWDTGSTCPMLQWGDGSSQEQDFQHKEAVEAAHFPTVPREHTFSNSFLDDVDFSGSLDLNTKDVSLQELDVLQSELVEPMDVRDIFDKLTDDGDAPASSESPALVQTLDCKWEDSPLADTSPGQVSSSGTSPSSGASSLGVGKESDLVLVSQGGETVSCETRDKGLACPLLEDELTQGNSIQEGSPKSSPGHSAALTGCGKPQELLESSFLLPGTVSLDTGLTVCESQASECACSSTAVPADEQGSSPDAVPIGFSVECREDEDVSSPLTDLLSTEPLHTDPPVEGDASCVAELLPSPGPGCNVSGDLMAASTVQSLAKFEVNESPVLEFTLSVESMCDLEPDKDSEVPQGNIPAEPPAVKLDDSFVELDVTQHVVCETQECGDRLDQAWYAASTGSLRSGEQMVEGLSLPEVGASATLPVRSGTSPSEEDLSPLKAVFDALDQDGDGFVRIEEFVQFATVYGAEQVKDLTRFLDPSGLGVISFEDFYRGISAISNGGSEPPLYSVGFSPEEAARGSSEEYDDCAAFEQNEVTDSAYLGSESTYSECETFTDEDTGTLVHPELHEEVETDSAIDTALHDPDDAGSRLSLGSELNSHSLVTVIGGEEEHFEDFGEGNDSELLLEGPDNMEKEHRSENQAHSSTLLLSPSADPFPASFQSFLREEALDFYCSQCHKQISRLEDLSTRLNFLEMNSTSKRLTSKKVARHLLQSSTLTLGSMDDLSRDILELADTDITDKVMFLEKRVSELEKDSTANSEVHSRLRQENLQLVHRANALEEQLKEQETRAEDALQIEIRRHKDAICKLERERGIELENLQSRLQQLDEENSELRSCVPCLRANIERLEEEKRKLQDELEDVTERLGEEMESRRKMADKLSHESHKHQKEKESMQELIEDLRKQLEHLQLYKLEVEARSGRSPSAGLQEYQSRTREAELEQEIRRLKQDNRSLKEQNDELNGQIINLSIQGAKNLFSASFSESLAAEISSVSRDELMEAIHKQEEINYRLQDYIDRIIVAIMESNPSILEVK